MTRTRNHERNSSIQRSGRQGSEAKIEECSVTYLMLRSKSLLLRNKKNSFCERRKICLTGLSWLTTVVFLLAVSSLSAAKAPVPAQPAGYTVVTDYCARIIEQACSNIYKGDFAAARQIIDQNKQCKNATVTELRSIISEYEAIEQKRESTRQSA